MWKIVKTPASKAFLSLVVILEVASLCPLKSWHWMALVCAPVPNFGLLVPVLIEFLQFLHVRLGQGQHLPPAQQIDALLSIHFDC